MAAPDPAIAQLQASLKANLVALSHILSFHASLSQLNASDYAPRAPKAMTRKLREEAQAFDALCDQVEQRVLRAMAVLERDARTAAGERLFIPPPASTTTAATGAEGTTGPGMDILPAAPGEGGDALLFPFSLDGSSHEGSGLQALALDLALPAATGEGGDELDFSILSDPSLFPPTDAAATEGGAPALFPTSAAPIPPTSAAPSDIPDLASLLSMAHSFPDAGAAPSSAATAVATSAAPVAAEAQATSGAAPAGLDLSAAGLESLFGSTTDLTAGGVGSADGAGLDGLMDFDMSSMDFSGLDMNLGGGELDLDELLKGFNTGQDGDAAT